MIIRTALPSSTWRLLSRQINPPVILLDKPVARRSSRRHGRRRAMLTLAAFSKRVNRRAMRDLFNTLTSTNEILRDMERMEENRRDAGAPFWLDKPNPEQKRDRRRQYRMHQALEGY